MAADHDEDFATEPVPDDKRIAWHTPFFAEMGIATALFFMQVTSILTQRYGMTVALLAIVYASIAASVIGYAIVRVSVATGFGMNLLARHVLGYRGAFLFSVIFGANSIIYFVAEAVIMGSSLAGSFPGASLAILLPAIALAMIPLVWFGIRVLAKFQFVTFILYGGLLLWAVWVSVHGHLGAHAAPRATAIRPVDLLAAFGTMNSVIFTAGLVSADYARFVRRSEMKRAASMLGIGFQAFCFAFSGLLGMWFSIRTGDENPGRYFVTLLGGWGAVFAIATQLRINLTNMYSGSISFANVFRQVADLDISRHVVVILFGIVAAFVMAENLLSNLMFAVGVIGMFVTCFTCLVLADMFLLGSMGPAGVRTGAVGDWNWPAVWSLVVATACGCLLQTGRFGAAIASMASLIVAAGQTLLYVRSARPRRAAVLLATSEES